MKFRFLKGAVVASAVLTFAAGIAVAETKQRTVSTTVGKEVRIAVHSHYGDDCKGTKKAKIALVRAPKHGKIVIKDSIENVDKPGETCHGKKVPGKGVFYVPDAGYTGKDRVVYDRQDYNGKSMWKLDATISVN